MSNVLFGLSRRQLLVGSVAAGMASTLPAGEVLAAAKSGRPWLGVAMSSGPMGGVLVDYVFKTSPADKAALRSGDMLVRVDKLPLDRPRDLVAHIKRMKPGMSVKLIVRRGGRERPQRVVLASHPGDDEVMRLMHVGNQAYQTHLSAVAGKVPARVQELRGRVVLMEFFASWCVNCRAMTPQLANWHKRYEQRGLTMLGVTSDPPDAARDTVNKWKIPYPVGSDAARLTQRAYRVSAVPALFVIDRKGIIRDVLIGYDPTRRAATEKLIEKLLKQR